MEDYEYEELITKGIDAVEGNDIHTALIYLNQAAEYRKDPIVQSYRAYCFARERGQIRSAARICQDSINKDRGNSNHYLILGRLQLMSGDRSKAIKTFRLGLKLNPSPLIIKELKMLGLRKPAVFNQFKRNNPLNLFFGKIFSILWLR